MIKQLLEKVSSFFEKPSRPAIPQPETPPEAAVPETPKKKPVKKAWDISCFSIPEVPDKTRFHDMDLPVSIMHGIFDCKFEYCTPIQAEILPQALKGLDVTGKAQTGTGKSAAFLISIYTRLMHNPAKEKRKPGRPRALILAPTRELALQIQKDAEQIGRYTRSRIISIFGGMDYEKQKRMLRQQVFDLMVATPGRLLDFQHQKIIDLSHVEILVIDEADRMLDMGFIPDIRKIVYSTPDKKSRQTMFFSATLTTEVIRLASQWTRQPFQVEIEPEQVASKSIDQVTYIVTDDQKFTLLWNLIHQEKLERVLVFANTREDTRNLVQKLIRYNMQASLLSGEVAQIKRVKTLEDFKQGKIRVLVATDVAARGIHVDAISHVINYTMPQDPEDYVHRIGRTGRAGETGIAISFASENDSFYIPGIETLLGHKMICSHPAEDLLLPLAPPPPRKQGANKRKPRPAGRSGKSSNPEKPTRKKSGSGYREKSSGNRPRNRKPSKPPRKSSAQ